MLFFIVAMFGVVIYLLTFFFKYIRVIKKEADGEMVIHKIDLKRKPNLWHLFLFCIVINLIYWIFI